MILSTVGVSVLARDCISKLIKKLNNWFNYNNVNKYINF